MKTNLCTLVLYATVPMATLPLGWWGRYGSGGIDVDVRVATAMSFHGAV